MNASQYEGITGRLDAILAKLPAVPQLDIPEDPVTVRRMDGSKTVVTRPVHAGPCWDGCARPEHRASLAKENLADKRQALAIMCAVLNDWIKGAKENHEAMDHRYENRGDECWRTFAPSDFRNMINDAARELGLQEFPLPEVPEEDKPCE